MVNIKPPNYKFCPFCAGRLQVIDDEERERKFCPSCNWTYYPQVFTAVTALIRKKGKVLMVKRGREPFKDTWMFPGGFIEYGENPLTTLRREVKEETGLWVKKARLIDILEGKNDPRAPGNLHFLYEVAVEEGEIKTDGVENKDIGWFEVRKPPKIGFASHIKIIKLLQGGFGNKI